MAAATQLGADLGGDPGLAVAYGVFGPPTMYVVDREGRLLVRGLGPREWASPAARRLIAELLRSPTR